MHIAPQNLKLREILRYRCRFRPLSLFGKGYHNLRVFALVFSIHSVSRQKTEHFSHSLDFKGSYCDIARASRILPIPELPRAMFARRRRSLARVSISDSSQSQDIKPFPLPSFPHRQAHQCARNAQPPSGENPGGDSCSGACTFAKAKLIAVAACSRQGMIIKSCRN